MEQATQVFAAVTLLVVGLSHLFRPNAWVAYFQGLARQGAPGAFQEGFVILPFGAFIAGFHNVWEGPAVLLTLIGWAQVLKAAGRFVAPEFGVRVMQRLTPEKAWYFRVGGVFALFLSGYVWWLRFGR